MAVSRNDRNKKKTNQNGKGHRVKPLSRKELSVYNNATHLAKWRSRVDTPSTKTQLVDWWSSKKFDYRSTTHKKGSIYLPSMVNIIDGNKCFGTVPFYGWRIATRGDEQPTSLHTGTVMHYKDYLWTIHMDTWRLHEGDTHRTFNEKELFEGLMLYKLQTDMIKDSTSKLGKRPSKCKWSSLKPIPVFQESKAHADPSLNYKDFHTDGHCDLVSFKCGKCVTAFLHFATKTALHVALDHRWEFDCDLINSFLALLNHKDCHAPCNKVIIPVIWSHQTKSHDMLSKYNRVSEVIAIVGDGQSHYGVLHIKEDEFFIYDGIVASIPNTYKDAFRKIRHVQTGVYVDDIHIHYPKINRQGHVDAPPNRGCVIQQVHLPLMYMPQSYYSCGAVACRICMYLLHPDIYPITDQTMKRCRYDVMQFIKDEMLINIHSIEFH